MNTATLPRAWPGVLRQPPWDARLAVLALAHGGLLPAVPTVPVVAVGL
jgi:hypothetical protein